MPSSRSWLALLCLIAPFVIACCGSDVRRGGGDDDGGEGGEGGSGGQPGAGSADKIDLLLVVDNSRGMADKQEILKLAVPELVQQLTNPPCVDATGNPVALQPTSALDDCPDPASVRDFEPVVDMHIGVITSSLGGHGSDACLGQNDASENDRGHLITRQTTSPAPVPTYEGLGFLVWDPDPASPTHAPPGESNDTALIDHLSLIVGGAGELGCGYEATLEAWYHFLVDPNPYETIEIENGAAILKGTDTTLLQQRQAFLRPDSLLAIVMISDENDCSIRDGGQFYFAGQINSPGTSTQYHLPKPRPECAANPNDPCCLSCGQSQEGCPDASAHCDADADGQADQLANLDDAINLRCYDQKRRFGIDFLYPIDRYVGGLTLPEVADRDGNVAANPLFSDLIPDDGNTSIRSADLVLLTGIVGVPWQDIARRNAEGVPDLLSGCSGDCADASNQIGGFQSASELLTNGTWDLILGDPSCYATDANCRPQDPLMTESIDPRSGANPVTGDPIASPGMPEGNGINGSEYNVPARDGLQYACIFPLVTQRDCSAAASGEACACKGFGPEDIDENPLCWDGSGFTNIQTHAAAYPGIRHLQVLRGVGPQGIVASICPAQQTDTTLLNFGYRPAMGSLVEHVKPRLSPAVR